MEPGTGQPGRQPARRLGILLAVAAFVYLADVISKVVVVATLSDRPPVRLLGGLLTLRVLRNSGAAFGIGTSMTVAFTVIAVGVIVVILRTSWRLRSLSWAIALGLLLGGATGNLTDRLLRSPGVFRGDVVDWIQVPHWPVFNLADSAIVCGVALWALLLVRGVPLEGSHEERGAPRDPDRAAGPAGSPDSPNGQGAGTQAPGSGQDGGAGRGTQAPGPGQDGGAGRGTQAPGPGQDSGAGRGADSAAGENRA